MTAKGPDGQRLPGFSDGPFVHDSVYKRLLHLVAPHVDSYDYFLESGLDTAVEDLPPMDVSLGDRVQLRMSFDKVHIQSPSKREDLCDVLYMTPRECRERHITYGGAMDATVTISITYPKSDNSADANESDSLRIHVKLGEIPIMVQSSKCHLSSLDQQELVDAREEANEMGGYFILNGIERVIRLLQVPRRNYATAIERSSFKNRGLAYSDKGVTMRCVRRDQTSVTITLHYLNSGGATLKFVLLKQEFLLPVVIVAKALADISDKEFFDAVLGGDHANTFLTTRIELLLRDATSARLPTRQHCLAYFGSLLRAYLPVDERTSDVEAGHLLLDR